MPAEPINLDRYKELLSRNHTTPWSQMDYFNSFTPDLENYERRATIDIMGHHYPKDTDVSCEGAETSYLQIYGQQDSTTGRFTTGQIGCAAAHRAYLIWGLHLPFIRPENFPRDSPFAREVFLAMSIAEASYLCRQKEDKHGDAYLEKLMEACKAAVNVGAEIYHTKQEDIGKIYTADDEALKRLQSRMNSRPVTSSRPLRYCNDYGCEECSSHNSSPVRPPRPAGMSPPRPTPSTPRDPRSNRPIRDSRRLLQSPQTPRRHGPRSR